jgi:hypothetical protein
LRHPGGERDDKLKGRDLSPKKLSRSQQNGQELLDLALSASRKKGDNGLFGIEIEFLESLFSREARSHDVEERVADPFDIHACRSVNRNFKREKNDHFPDPLADQFYSAGSPSPHLGTDVIQDRDPPLMSRFGKAEIKIRKVDEDDEIRPLPIEGSFQLSEGSQDDPEFEEDLCNAHDRKGTMVIEKGHACTLEGVSSHAKTVDMRIHLTEGFQQMGAVKISRGLACDHHHLL